MERLVLGYRDRLTESQNTVHSLTRMQRANMKTIESLTHQLELVTAQEEKFEAKNELIKLRNGQLEEGCKAAAEHFINVCEKYEVYSKGVVEEYEVYFEQFETSLYQLNDTLLHVQVAVHDQNETRRACPPFAEDMFQFIEAGFLAEQERLHGIIRDLEQRVSDSGQAMTTPTDAGYVTPCDGSATADSCIILTAEVFQSITAASDAELERMRAIIDKGALDLKNAIALYSLEKVHAEQSIIDLRVENSGLMGQLQELTAPYDLASFTGGTAFTDALLQLSDWETRVGYLYTYLCTMLLGVGKEVFSFSYFMNSVICKVELKISPFDKTLLEKCKDGSTQATETCFKPDLDIRNLKDSLKGTTLHPSTHTDEFSAVLIRRMLYLKNTVTDSIRTELQKAGVELSPM